MPRFDGTGPQGQGARTGRGMGNCVTSDTPAQQPIYGAGQGGGGRGGAGQGGGRGGGRGFASGKGRKFVSGGKQGRGLRHSTRRK